MPTPEVVERGMVVLVDGGRRAWIDVALPGLAEYWVCDEETGENIRGPAGDVRSFSEAQLEFTGEWSRKVQIEEEVEVEPDVLDLLLQDDCWDSTVFDKTGVFVLADAPSVDGGPGRITVGPACPQEVKAASQFLRQHLASIAASAKGPAVKEDLSEDHGAAEYPSGGMDEAPAEAAEVNGSMSEEHGHVAEEILDAGPSRAYILDNSVRKAPSDGLRGRLTKNHSDFDTRDEAAIAWGTKIMGREVSGGWLQVTSHGDTYVPTHADGVRVLVPLGRYRADNGSAKIRGPGLALRAVKRIHSETLGVVNWGEEVEGVDEGDGWLRVGETFLPLKHANGMPVLVHLGDASLEASICSDVGAPDVGAPDVGAPDISTPDVVAEGQFANETGVVNEETKEPVDDRIKAEQVQVLGSERAEPPEQPSERTEVSKQPPPTKRKPLWARIEAMQEPLMDLLDSAPLDFPARPAKAPRTERARGGSVAAGGLPAPDVDAAAPLSPPSSPPPASGAPAPGDESTSGVKSENKANSVAPAQSASIAEADENAAEEVEESPNTPPILLAAAAEQDTAVPLPTPPPAPPPPAPVAPPAPPVAPPSPPLAAPAIAEEAVTSSAAPQRSGVAPLSPSAQATVGTGRSGGAQGGGSMTIEQWIGQQGQFAALPSLPHGWIRIRSTSSGTVYYANTFTGATQLLEPSELPPGWTKQVARSTGRTYFFNASTGVSTFDLPLR